MRRENQDFEWIGPAQPVENWTCSNLDPVIDSPMALFAS